MAACTWNEMCEKGTSSMLAQPFDATHATFLMRTFPFITRLSFTHPSHAECLKMPHIINIVVALACSIVFCIIAFAMTIADFEMNPVSQRWLAAPDTRVEVGGCTSHIGTHLGMPKQLCLRCCGFPRPPQGLPCFVCITPAQPNNLT